MLQNKRLLYDLLFRSSAADLLEVARDPKHLGADIGLLSVLAPIPGDRTCNIIRTSTRSFRLADLHPMAHAGSLLLQVSSLPVRVLSRVFRGKFTAELRQLFDQDKLEFHGSLTQIAETAQFRRFLRQLYRQDWVVYAKPPFGGAEHLLQYLARYTHRVAISNHRLVSFEHDRVSFRWKDYAHGGKQKVMTVSAEDFLRRFLIHVLPRGLVRIRHFGLFANRHRAASLARCRSLLGVSASAALPDATANQLRCPVCSGPMLIIERMTTSQVHFRSDRMPQNQPRYVFDSS